MFKIKVNRDEVEHYIWKEKCDGWHLLKDDNLSIIAEKMPPHTQEDLHYHEYSKQFFYILSGTATMVFKNRVECILEGEGIEIFPKESHQMSNFTDKDIEFIVISYPPSHGDKKIINQQI